MSSNYTFCGYRFQGPGSKAGTSTDGGINLNSATAQYNLQNNPELCRMIYEGIVPSYYGNTPTVEDCGSGTIADLPTVIEYNEKGEVTDVNPVELATLTGQIPTVNFTGALNPIYHDNAQPTTPMGYTMPFQNMSGFGQPMMNGYMPLNFTPPGAVPYNYNPVNPAMPVQNMGEVMQEWNEYQRRKGFRAPIPTDTDFPEFGLLSGFHRGFDPMACTAPGQDEFYDPSCGGRLGLSEAVHMQALANATFAYGWVPGQLIERREQMMFPGINDDHSIPTPANHPVIGYNGMVQRRLGNGSPVGPMMWANQLPISNMVATNPYMAGMNQVGGFNMYGVQQNLPTPYMQARYNYAIYNGFQSVQEMDNNDFRILKRVSRCAHPEMNDEEHEQFFIDNWCKRFTDINEWRAKAAEANKKRQQNNPEIPRVKVQLKKGDKVLAGTDGHNNEEYMRLCASVRQCNANYKSPEVMEWNRQREEQLRAMKDNVVVNLYSSAPERKYDDKPMLEFMEHGWVESFFYHLNHRVQLDRMDPKKRLQAAHIDQVGFMRNCIERGMGMLPAAKSRIKTEDEMFYVNKPHPDEEIADKPRGTWGVKANGEPLDPNFYPMYGYATYIADPEHPEMSIPFPRAFIQDVYDGYTKYCVAVNQISKKKAKPMSYDEFEESTGVRVIDNDDFLKGYSGIEGTEDLSNTARKALNQKLQVPTWAHMDPSIERDRYEFEDPCGDIPLEVLQRDLEENPS